MTIIPENGDLKNDDKEISWKSNGGNELSQTCWRTHWIEIQAFLSFSIIKSKNGVRENRCHKRNEMFPQKKKKNKRNVTSFLTLLLKWWLRD